jgi:hypothetical protein
MPKLAYPFQPFPIDHIIARQHKGLTENENLAYSCLHCNGCKGPNIAGIDPKTGKLVPLFHARRNKWSSHFRWNGPNLVGKTAVGRATLLVLNLNCTDLIQVRESLLSEGYSFE